MALGALLETLTNSGCLFALNMKVLLILAALVAAGKLGMICIKQHTVYRLNLACPKCADLYFFRNCRILVYRSSLIGRYMHLKHRKIRMIYSHDMVFIQKSKFYCKYATG